MKTLALLFLVSGLICFGAGTSFPSAGTSTSPDLRWNVRSVTAPNQDGGFSHVLILTNASGKRETGIWIAERGCDVLWCGDSQRLALTDWTGSNLSEIYLVEMSDPRGGKRLEVKNAQDFVGKSELEGHCYFDAVLWGSPHQLLIRVYGHTDENPSHAFEYHLSVNTTTGVAALVKAPPLPPTVTPAAGGPDTNQSGGSK